MEHAESVTESRPIYSGKVLSVRIDTVRLQDGSEATREIVEHNGAVCIVPVDADDCLLMVRQYRLAAGKALLEIPAGKLEAGEDPRECAARELAEETGSAAEELIHLGSFYLAPGYSTELMHAYLATGLSPAEETQADDDERIELVRVPIGEAAAMAASGALTDSKTIAAILMALTHPRTP